MAIPKPEIEERVFYFLADMAFVAYGCVAHEVG